MTGKPYPGSLVQASILILVVLFALAQDKTTQAQRSLHHWKRDLEHRLKIYQENQNIIDSIISTAIYSKAGGQRQYSGPVRITSNGNVRFSDLIVPSGSLRLSPHVAPSTVRILVDKTQAYVNSKTNELNQIESQLDTINRQLDDPANQYIYKGTRGPVAQAPRNLTAFIGGTRVFKQAQHAQLIQAANVTVRHINYTDAGRVIDDTYLRNLKFGVFDSQGRLFLEGRKTFWDTVFMQPLESGCCDRLKPLHTNRMMLRSVPQDVRAPILIHARETAYNQKAKIGQLSTQRFYNKLIVLDQRPGMKPPGDLGLAPSPPPENFVRLGDLIDIRQLDQPQILKTLVFMNPVVIDEAQLANSYPDNRLVIGIGRNVFDLSHDNYLLRYGAARANYSLPEQRVSGTLFLEAGQTSFLAGVEAQTVNRISNFGQFVSESLVNINRPTTIRGPIQFNALPAVFSSRDSSVGRPAPGLQILRALGDLEVALVNGMRVPQDLVVLPLAGYNERVALRPGQEVRVRGPRHFANRAAFELLQVSGPVNGLALPDDVIPLHLNDFVHNVGHSNLRFLDGITVAQMTVQSNQFDEIDLRDVNGDAQSIVIRSMSTLQPDGSTLIRAPLRVMNLNLINSGPNRGLLNGFRPQEVIELNKRDPYEIMYGRKKFLAPVEAVDCIFNDINQVANWTNHLIRIDRPNTVQTVHTRLAFAGAPLPSASGQPASPTAPLLNQSASVNIDRLTVEFQPDSGRESQHRSNWNFSPELYLLHQALLRNAANHTGGRYRVDQVRLGGSVNGIPLGDIVTLDKPFRFADTFTMVGKVEVRDTLSAGRIQSTYPIDVMDLVQFDKHRISITSNTRAPIKLANIVLGQDNRASFVQGRLLNGVPFTQFAQSVMSLTRPQDIHSNLVFNSPVSFEGWLRTKASLNGIKNFDQFARSLKSASYSFEEGLQCNSVVVKT